MASNCSLLFVTISVKYLRFSADRSGSLRKPEKPNIAFKGVLISCETLFRKAVFRRLLS